MTRLDLLRSKEKQVITEIKMFERDRIENDPTNTNRYKPLYEVLYKIQEEIKKLEG